MKSALEAIIKAERSLEAAMIKLMSVESTFRTKQDRNSIEFIQRERLELDKAQTKIMASKARLQTMFHFAEKRNETVAQSVWRRIKKPSPETIAAMQQ